MRKIFDGEPSGRCPDPRKDAEATVPFADLAG
jgi:hypothetical protein